MTSPAPERAAPTVRPFELERYFAAHQDTTALHLGSSAPQPWSVGEILALEPESRSRLEALTLGYSDPNGTAELRHRIASLYSGVTSDEIVVHSSGEEAIFTFMTTRVHPGDRVIVQTPCYQSLAEIARFRGAEVVPWPADPRNRWQPDPGRLEASITNRTRLLVLNQPNNPTGAVLEADRFSEVLRIARRHGLILFVDEAYRGLELEASHRLPAVCDVYEKGVSLGMLSKTWALPGLRIGWLATQLDLSGVRALKDYTTISSSGPSELLASIALRHGRRIVAHVQGRMARNLKLLEGFLGEFEDVLEGSVLQAGPILFPRVVRIGAEELAERLRLEAGVLVLPGRVFGHSNHLRLGFGREDLELALNAAAPLIRRIR